MRKRRKPRIYEYTCTCGAYKFPHRFGGGRCSGYYLVAEQWENHYGSGDCTHCNACNRTEDIPYCEVYEGQERVEECPAWQEFVHYNEIRIYK